MPYACCVPGCKSNYESKGDNVSVFRFPKDETRRTKWVQHIHRKDYVVTKNSRVCIKHFADHFILREDQIVRPDGSVLISPRSQIKLTDDAYPTIFENQPSYMTTSLPPKRKPPILRHLQQEKRKKIEEERNKEADRISGFEDLKNRVSEQTKPFEDEFILKIFENKVCLMNIVEGECNTDLPYIKKCVTINNELGIRFLYKKVEINNKELISIIGNTKICNTWSVLTKLLQYTRNYNVQNTTVDTVAYICKMLAKVRNDTTCTITLDKLKFCQEQIQLINCQKIRYSTDILIWASMVFFTFPGAYCLIEKSNLLTLPSPQHLRRLLLKLGTKNSGIDNSHINYLTKKLKMLTENEKFVILMLDEIYVKKDIAYKGGKIEGFALNQESAATTIQAFMISSVLSQNKDVVGLYPVCTLKHDFLHKLVLNVLEM